MVFPEAYSLSPSMDTEPWVSSAGPDGLAAPCDLAGTAAGDDSPIQVRLSCAARAAKVAILANVFASLPNGYAVALKVLSVRLLPLVFPQSSRNAPRPQHTP